MENTVKQRIISFIKYQKLSQRKFENSINVSNGFVNNISKSIGADKLQRILSVYPDLNPDWLLYGEGEMLKTSEGSTPSMLSSDEATTVLLLPVSAQGGSLNDFVLSVKESDCVKIVSPIHGVDFAMQVTGDSMSPEYPNGSYILIKRINEKAFIDWGKTYVLDTCNGLVIKCIVPSDKEGYIRCVSINTEPKYAPFDVALSDIFGIYKVLLCMSIK